MTSAAAIQALQRAWAAQLRASVTGNPNAESLERLILHPAGTTAKLMGGTAARRFAQATVDFLPAEYRKSLVAFGSVGDLKLGAHVWLITTTARVPDGWLRAFVDATTGEPVLLVRIPEG
jgi:hypothetical protein